VPVIGPALPEDAAQLAARRAQVARQLDLMLDLRGPVDQVRRLLADLDRISADLAQTLRQAEERTQRQDR
jgi:hypothetical protein